ncbi:MAG: hypothetical protein HUJ98_13525, partial [Bacteroidaceae bacterium]|nr:hypothetical protein [Bacteroidaceae bacterium]
GMTQHLSDKINEKAKIDAKYPNGFPTDEQKQNLKDYHNAIEEATAAIQRRNDSIFSSKNIPSNVKMDEIKAKAKQFNDNQLRLQSLATMQETAPKMPMGILIVGIVLLVVGVWLAVTISSVGYAAVGVGALLTVFALTKSMSKSQTPNNDGIKIKQDNDILESELREFFSQYNMFSTQFTAHFQQLEKEINSYQEYKKLLIDSKKKVEDCQKQIASISASLGLEPPHDIPQAIFQYDRDQSQMAEIEKEIKKFQQQCEDFKAEKGLTEKPVIGDCDVEDLNRKDKDLQYNITRLEDRIKEDEDVVSEIDALKEQKKELLKEKSNLEADFKVIEETINFIELANKNLLEKYVAPIKNKYKEFIQRLLPNLSTIAMDHTYKISFQLDENGTPRDCNHLSSGERICLEMALRMALIDNMYKDERPFLMLDDPFTDLDEENFNKAKAMVRNISERTQVIYLCCHPTREISK